MPTSRTGTAPVPRELVREFIATHGPADAVGHRIVHGGSGFVGPVVVDQPAQRAIESLGALAPLHQARGIAGIVAAREMLPDAIQVACFDTAFHAALPLEAATYPLPAEWREQWPIRRYGFHGLSHASVVRRVPRLLGTSVEGLRIVSCHLGSGASLCATRDGHSLDTTMGFTPLDGLVMATRSGSIDPGLVLWLIGNLDGGLDEVNRGLEERSGLVGLAGGTGDMREIIERRRHGDSVAALAFDVYLHRLAAPIAAMTAAIGGLDVLVFTRRGRGTLARGARGTREPARIPRHLHRPGPERGKRGGRPRHLRTRRSSPHVGHPIPRRSRDRTSDPLSRART